MGKREYYRFSTWSVKEYSKNKFAEFSSFYSSPGEIDEVWLITPEVALGSIPTLFSFVTQARYHNHDNLSVWISKDYDGTTEGISTATWQPLAAYMAQPEDVNKFKSSGFIDLSEFGNSTVRVGFKYLGNKQANKTTTYQLDNISIFEN